MNMVLGEMVHGGVWVLVTAIRRIQTRDRERESLDIEQRQPDVEGETSMYSAPFNIG